MAGVFGFVGAALVAVFLVLVAYKRHDLRLLWAQSRLSRHSRPAERPVVMDTAPLPLSSSDEYREEDEVSTPPSQPFSPEQSSSTPEQPEQASSTPEQPSSTHVKEHVRHIQNQADHQIMAVGTTVVNVYPNPCDV